MKNVKLIADILHFLSKFIAFLYLATAIYASLVMLIAKFGKTSLFQTGNSAFTIMYPFTDSPFLLGDHTSLFMIMMIVTLVSYSVFAWILGDVFAIFRNEKLFTRPAVNILTRFYLLNFILPATVLVINLFFTDDVKDLLVISILHGIIGLFAWFMAAIFKQGLSLQDEQDHTL